jgi:uncharacterized protein DUF4304
VAAPTQWQLALGAAQVPVTEVLKRLGFRKNGNYYNRSAKDGLTQVVGFQSGRAVSIFHGNFTVNLGVYVPCIAKLEGNEARGRYVTDAHCEIRSRLSAVAALGEDRWWPLDDSASSAGVEIAKALRDHGVPFLEQYSDFRSIIERFETDGSLPFHNPARSTLAVAIIQWSRGQVEAARSLFATARSMPSHNVHFSSYVASVQSQCGV